MDFQRIFGLDGASAVLSHVEPRERIEIPVLVACPAPWLASVDNVGAAMAEIYRVAYEKALMAARPSAYQLACRASQN